MVIPGFSYHNKFLLTKRSVQPAPSLHLPSTASQTFTSAHNLTHWYLRLDNELHQKRIGEAKASLETRGDELLKSNQVIADRRTDLDIKRTELEEIVSETKAEEEKFKEKAHNVEATIEPRLLSAFKRIRKNSRNGLAVVYVQRDACGGCFNKVPPQRQLDIRTRKKIIVCEYCGRILVDPELAGVKVEAKNLEDKPRRRRVVKRREE